MITGVIPEFTLGDRLRKARELRGLEQQELAEQLGIHRQSVARYEKGDAEPRKPVMTLWAIVTGVDLEWLSGDDEGPRRSEGLDVARPKGLEPLTFCSVSAGLWEFDDTRICPRCGGLVLMFADGHLGCQRCGLGREQASLDEELAFWSVVGRLQLVAASPNEGNE